MILLIFLLDKSHVASLSWQPYQKIHLDVHPFSFVVEYLRLFNILLLHFKVLMKLSGFLEMGVGLLVEAEASVSARSVQGMVMRVVSVCGEGLISNLVYALLGVSAMSRVKGFLRI